MTDNARVSTAPGKWSVALAASSPVVGVIAFFVLAFGLNPGGGLSDVMFRGAFLVTAAMVIAAIVLGVKSIVGAWPKKGQPESKWAMFLGVSGIGISAVVCAVLIWLYF